MCSQRLTSCDVTDTDILLLGFCCAHTHLMEDEEEGLNIHHHPGIKPLPSKSDIFQIQQASGLHGFVPVSARGVDVLNRILIRAVRTAMMPDALTAAVQEGTDIRWEAHFPPTITQVSHPCFTNDCVHSLSISKNPRRCR